LKAIRKNERKEKQETIAITDHAVGWRRKISNNMQDIIIKIPLWTPVTCIYIKAFVTLIWEFGQLLEMLLVNKIQQYILNSWCNFAIKIWWVHFLHFSLFFTSGVHIPNTKKRVYSMNETPESILKSVSVKASFYN
jgi:hypothetical protein